MNQSVLSGPACPAPDRGAGDPLHPVPRRKNSWEHLRETISKYTQTKPRVQVKHSTQAFSPLVQTKCAFFFLFAAGTNPVKGQDAPAPRASTDHLTAMVTAIRLVQTGLDFKQVCK